MLVSILADLSVLMSTVLIFFLTRDTQNIENLYSFSEKIKYTMIMTVVGLLLMRFSVVVEGVRYDYRFLLYAFAIKYLGKSITLSSIFMISMCRFFWGSDINTYTSLAVGILSMLLLPIIQNVSKKITSDVIQLTINSISILFISAMINLIVHGDFFKDANMYFTLCISSFLMIIILAWIIRNISLIKEKADRDYLTTLKNSRRFYADVNKFSTVDKYSNICILDIDFFKQVNDSFGHQAGDTILQMVANEFIRVESSTVDFYRIGGEEFACFVRKKALMRQCNS